ncbi:endonuclease/exonuclease/phosphatase family protein [Nitzschia inconspicua]|uniref:Endonuclease/exonuclease/phosphatase family protein n=1 Tax=Nitzschia inconspicua TaxID=303405 RepID=A0A9K3KBZ6_9STRA|nr:endonuclease/exonuclease/phosphatase family protein [Nitzschia inconspicua]
MSPSSSSSSSWMFRPSVLQQPNYHLLTVDEITDYYVRDNERAEQENVSVPSHPLQQQQQQQQRPVEQSSSSSSSSCSVLLRTAQWNIQAWRSPHGNRADILGIQNTLRQTNADVLILNEYHWNDYNQIHADFERFLRFQGYRRWYCGTNSTPTLVASKHNVLEYKEIILSYERSALCLKLDVAASSRPVWVVGTHLDHLDGSQRQLEIKRLLNSFKDHSDNDNHGSNNPFTIISEHEPVILAGDFNQQRQRDYTKMEWQRIATSMAKRKACRDDGVGNMLELHSFRCVFDQLLLQHTSSENNNNNNQVLFNWKKASLPPSTHWSGTTIDYSYSRNLSVHGVYISPAGFSDHRMTVCDWSVPTDPAQAPTATIDAWNDKDHYHMPTTTTTTTTTTISVSTMVTTTTATWIADDASSSAGSI